MKKIISVLAMVTLLFGTVGTNAAETSMEDVLKIVKGRIGTTDAYEEFSSDTYEDENGMVYSFSWQKDKDDYNKYLTVNCTNTGTITSYYDYSVENSEYGVKFQQSRISVEDAMKTAQCFADKLNPDLAGELIVEMPERYNSYVFDIKRIKNGLEVANEGGRIALDKSAEKIRFYEIETSENQEFVSAENLIGKESAVKKYGEKLGMEPEYKFKYTYNRETRKSERELYLQYKAKNNEKISAISGETIMPSKLLESYKYAASGGANLEFAEMKDDGELSKLEFIEAENMKGLLSKDELIKIAREAAVIGNDFEVYGFETVKEKYYTDIPVRYNASISFVSADEENDDYIRVSVDAQTGEVIYFDKPNAENKKSILSDEEIRNIADKTAKKFCGEKFTEYKAEEYTGKGCFTYIRYINGIKFDEDKICVGIDTVTGEVTDYGINYTKISFPSSEDIISKSAAEEKLFARVEYRPIYMKTSDGKMTPVYDFTDGKSLCIDAKTGELIRNGNIYEDEIIKYDDIKNHYSEAAVKALAELGHGFGGGSFKPEEKIAQKDFLKLLCGNYTENVYERIETDKAGVAKNENAPITKEDAAKILVYNLGNGMFELAESDIFKSPFADVTENVGFAAILKGKNVVSGDENGLFKPKENLTRADAAIMIYRYFVSNGHD